MLISPFSHLKAEWEMSPRHFNGATRVLQSHCWVLLSQTWMRPPPPAHWRRWKSLREASALSLFSVFYSRDNIKASSASSGVLMTLWFAGECKVSRTLLLILLLWSLDYLFSLQRTRAHMHFILHMRLWQSAKWCSFTYRDSHKDRNTHSFATWVLLGKRIRREAAAFQQRATGSREIY